MLFTFLDQDPMHLLVVVLILYYSSCWSDCLKKPKLRRFKSDQDEI